VPRARLGMGPLTCHVLTSRLGRIRGNCAIICWARAKYCGIGREMNGRPTPIGVSAVRHAKQRRKRGIVAAGGWVPLSAEELIQHARLLKEGRPMSGKSGRIVYYMDKGRQRWRRDVPQRDPRTFAQLRSRTVFAAASRTWSQGGPLTQEQRDAWYAEGAKTQSRPRLNQSGPLTGQQRFIGRNSTKARRRQAMLLDPRPGKPRQPQVTNSQPHTIAPPPRRPVKRGYLRKANHTFLTAQLA
jgi:hypothetical protein